MTRTGSARSISGAAGWAIKVGTAALGVVLALFLIEGMLFVAGDPDRLHESVTNPPGMRVDVNNAEYQYVWETNSMGLRYPQISLRKPGGSRRIVVVGDSFAEGEGMAIEARFTTLLERRFSRPRREVRFINAALGGQGVLQYARIFHWVGTRYDPDALLVCIGANDLADMPPTATGSSIREIEIRPRGFASRAAHALWPRIWRRSILFARNRSRRERGLFEPGTFDVDQVVRLARARGIPGERIESWRSRLPAEWVTQASEGRLWAYLLPLGLFRPDYFVEAFDVDGPRAERRWSAMEAVLDELVGDARRRGVQVALVFLPNLYLYDPLEFGPEARFPFTTLGGEIRSSWLEGVTEFQRRIEDWSSSRGLPYHDLTEAFRVARLAGRQLHYPVDGHWNDEGHALAAGEIARWMEREGIFAGLR